MLFSWNFKKKKGCQLFSYLLKTEGTLKKWLDKNRNGATLWTKQEVSLLLRSLGKVPLVRPTQHVMQMDKVWTAGDRNLKCHQRPPAMMFRNTEMFLIWSEVFFSRSEAFVIMKASIVCAIPACATKTAEWNRCASVRVRNEGRGRVFGDAFSAQSWGSFPDGSC